MFLSAMPPAQKVKAFNDKQTNKKYIIGPSRVKKKKSLVWVHFVVSDDDVNTTITDASHISSD